MQEKTIKEQQKQRNGLPKDGQPKDRLKPIEKYHGLTEAQIIHVYKSMVINRVTDDRIDVLIKQGRAAFLISGAGHEAVQVAFALALTPKKDWVFPYYRDNALGIAMGITSENILQHIMGRATDPFTGGRQMSMHLGSKELRMPTQSSPTGSQFLQAVGAAISCVFRKTDEVVYVSGGEGSTSEGEFFEAINWSARAKLPIIFCIQNNKFAISVPVEDQTAGGSVYKACAGFEDLHRVQFDGTNFLESYKAAREAVKIARSGKGP
ncbi:MAG: thiamine pyrophosphate-dependent dehydrogenase E1 component subunit alpha, partial [Ignavibacteria bacterium]